MTCGNTLNLVGDGDEIDLLEEVEAAFSVKIEAKEAEELLTVGDLQDVLLRKLDANEARRSACLTAVAFYRLRTAISEVSGAKGIIPSTLLNRSLLGLDYEKWAATIEARCGLELPIGRAGVLTTLLFVALFFGSPVAAATLGKSVGAWGLLPLLGWLLIYPLFRFMPALRPSYCKDAGSLARAVAGLNYRSLSHEFGSRHPDDVLLALVAVLRNFTGFSRPVDRRTTFFAQ